MMYYVWALWSKKVCATAEQTRRIGSALAAKAPNFRWVFSALSRSGNGPCTHLELVCAAVCCVLMLVTVTV
eukprot:scaffold10055_cov101-Isochrysis_galbana.AAC.1